MDVKLYLNGLYWKNVEIRGGESFDVIVGQGTMSEYMSNSKMNMHTARFRIVAVPFDGLGETYFGMCIDPKLYIGRGGIQCHNIAVFSRAARELGLNVS